MDRLAQGCVIYHSKESSSFAWENNPMALRVKPIGLVTIVLLVVHKTSSALCGNT